MEYCLPVFELLKPGVCCSILLQQTHFWGWWNLKQPGLASSCRLDFFQCLDLIARLATRGGCLDTTGMDGTSFFKISSLCRIGCNSLIHLWKGGFAGLSITQRQFLILFLFFWFLFRSFFFVMRSILFCFFALAKPSSIISSGYSCSKNFPLSLPKYLSVQSG